MQSSPRYSQGSRWHPHKEHQQGQLSGPQFFTLEKCAGCQLHKILRAGETWQHRCVEDESILQK